MGRRILSTHDELLELVNKSFTGFIPLFEELARSALQRDAERRARAFERLQRRFTALLTFANLLARRRVLLQVDTGVFGFAAGEVPPWTRADFKPEEAIRDLVSREPRLAKTAEEVAELYRKEHAFALAWSAEKEITKRVQKEVARALREGKPEPSAVTAIRAIGDWTRAYANTVYRTNVVTAFEAGNQRQAEEPEVAAVAPAFRFTATLDADVRPNHAAAHGLIAGVNDPVWGRFSPPLGYNCRCSRNLVSRFELKRLGLLRQDGSVKPFYPRSFRNAHPDPGFGFRK